MATMRAKLVIESVTNYGTQENVKFRAVVKSGSYPADGLDEDNTFAKFTPSAALEIMIANPALLGKLKPGAKYYVDFTEIGA